MLANILPEQAGKILSDNGSYPALTAGQKAALIDGVENSGGITFGGASYGANLLTGGTATASDFYNATYNAAKAADGSTGTWWETQNLNPPHWWKYQLAAAKTATKLRIKCGHIYGLKNFTLDGSNDNVNWTTVYTGLSAQVTTWQDFTFTNATAYLYYRINGSDIWIATYSFRIEEFELYDSTQGSLKVNLDATGGGDWPVNEIRYFTTETDVAQVTIKTSTDNVNWTARTTALGGAAFLKAAVGAAIRYVTIDHPAAASQTSYEIEVITQRCPRPLAAAYHVLRASSRWAAPAYNIIYLRAAVKFIGSCYSVYQQAKKPSAVQYHVLQAASRHARASYHLFQVTKKGEDARYHIRPVSLAFMTAQDSALEAVITGLLKAGAASAEFSFHLWNGRGAGGGLKTGNIIITAMLNNGLYSGGTNPQGQEAVTGKWVELKSSGILGAGITDDAQAAFTPVGGQPAAGGLAVGVIPAGAGRVIVMRINVPASPATPFSTTPALNITYDVFADPGCGGAYGNYFGG